MASVNVKMVEHIIITAGFLWTGMDGKLAVWVITKGKSCLQPCFPRCFGYCIFQGTRHPERLSYQSVISRNSTAVTHCRVMMALFYIETTASERQVWPQPILFLWVCESPATTHWQNQRKIAHLRFLVRTNIIENWILINDKGDVTLKICYCNSCLLCVTYYFVLHNTV